MGTVMFPKIQKKTSLGRVSFSLFKQRRCLSQIVLFPAVLCDHTGGTQKGSEFKRYKENTKTQLTDNRIEALADLDFARSVLDRESLWETRFLRSFKHSERRINGHHKVLRKSQAKALECWMRNAKRKGKMTREKESLESTGFQWYIYKK